MPMPHVLMLCYYFPPIIASGTTRSLAFAQNLKDLGWEPVVLTVDRPKDPWIKSGGNVPPGMTIIRTPEWNLGGLADFFQGCSSRVAKLAGKDLTQNFWRETFCLPDQQIAWSSTVKGTELAGKCDVIYASCSPFSSAISAAKIKARTGKPLVLDFRDAWSLNPHLPHSDYHWKKIRLLEQAALDACDRLVLNTEGASALYRDKYPQHAAKISAIPNGYDELTPVSNEREAGGPFRIMHIGSFYGARSPRLLLEALAELPEIPAEFIQVGGDFPERKEFEGRMKITVHPPVPREKALEMMGKASLLYLKQGFEPGVSHYIAVAAKTYEYLATGLPILAEVPPGDNADIVSRYASAGYVVTSESKSELKDAIRRSFETRSSTVPHVTTDFVRDFSRKRLTGQLADIFNGLKR